MTDDPAAVGAVWQSLKDAILATPDGNTVLESLRRHPDQAAKILEAWVEAHRDRVAPEVSTVVLGGSIDKLVPIAHADVVKVYQPTLSGTLELQLHGIRERHRLFAGRKSELKQLDDVLVSGDSRVVLVTGGPGRGKSALLASWIASLQGRSDVACCYTFISRADETATQDFTVRALCQQMLALRKESTALPANADELVALYLERVASDPARGRPLAIVIDGLDEAVGWSPGKLIPVRLPPRTFLVCSARAIADRDWVEELRLDEASVVQISLAPLTVADTGAMLRAAGSRAAELAGDPAFVGAVHGASGGEPSHLRFLAEDIEAGRVASVADVTKQPAGLRAYFDRWWRELAAEPLSGPVRDLLAYLHVARGPIGRRDLMAISGSDALDSFSVDAAIHRVERYVSGTRDDGYAIAQPRFREYMTEHTFEPSDLDPYRLRLCDYCMGAARLDSMYALRHLVEHLDDLDQPAAIIALARDDGYLHAQRQRLPEEPEPPLAVTRLAIGRAVASRDGAAMAELALRHAGRSGASLPWPSPLGLAEDGRVPASWTCADYREPELAVLWHLLVGWYVGDSGNQELAAATVARLVGRSMTRLAEWRGPSHVRLLAQQPEGADSFVAPIAAALLDGPKRYLLCVELIERGRLRLVRSVAETIDDELLRALIAGILARSDFGGADLLIDGIRDPFMRALGQHRFAGAVAGEREQEARARLGAAADLLLRCPVTMDVIGALAVVAANQAQLDDRAAARATLDASEPLGVELPPGLERGVGLGLLAAARLRLGDRQACDRLIAAVRKEGQGTKDPEERSRMLATVALQLAFPGGVESAISLGEEIDDEPIAADLHGWMAAALANEGAVDDAARLAELARGATTHALALHALAAAHARAGMFEQARDTASAITDVGAATQAFISIAESAVQQANLDEAKAAYLAAREVATSVSDGGAELIALVMASSARQFTPVVDSMVEPAVAAARRLEDEACGAALGAVAAALATAGRTGEASSIVATILDAAERVRAWAKLGDVHARAGRAAEARRAFAAAFEAEETVSREWAHEGGRTRRDQTVAEIVDTECDRAAFPQACEHALHVLDSERRAELLLTIARRQAASGDVDSVATTLRLARAAAETVEVGEVTAHVESDPRDSWIDRPDTDFDVPERSPPFAAPQLTRPRWELVQSGRWKLATRRRGPGDSVARVAVTYAELGLIGDGLALARTLSAAGAARGLAGVARFQMTNGDPRSAGETFDEAVRLADSLQGSERVRVLSDVGYCPAVAGDTGRGRAILGSALEAAQRIEGGGDGEKEDSRDNLIAAVAFSMARSGLTAEAARAAEQIEDGQIRYESLANTAVVLGEAQDFDTALRLAAPPTRLPPETEEDDVDRSQGLGWVADVAVRAGRLDVVDQILAAVEEDDELRGSMQRLRVWRLAGARRFEEAEAAALEIPDERERVEALCEVARALHDGGLAGSAPLESALQVVERASDQDRDWLRVPIVECLASMGGFDEAARLAEAMGRTWRRSGALRAIAVAQARQGRPEEAIATARAIASERAESLVAIADAMVSTGETHGALRLLEPAAAYLDGAYAMCTLLTRALPDQVTAIGSAVSTFDTDAGSASGEVGTNART